MKDKIVSSFRDGDLAKGLAGRLRELAARVGTVTLMEVCGTHTVSIFRSGVRELLGGNVRLLSGPGCPVCVTPPGVIDAAIEYARREDTILATFGDMVRVPGSAGTLEEAKAGGHDVRVVYSPTDALKIAAENSDKKVVFTGVGFETTAPLTATVILNAVNAGIKNFAVLNAHRTVPAALETICETDGFSVNGFICPGHVSVVIGSSAYLDIAQKYKMPCVVTGFEPLDIMHGIIMLLEQVIGGRSEVQVQYSRAVKENGNPVALEKMWEVFEPVDAEWRGLGVIGESGLAIREKYADYDAAVKWPVQVSDSEEPDGCKCGDVLAGRIIPPECALFGRRCTTENPVGPCMVSSEGACAAYFKYGDFPD